MEAAAPCFGETMKTTLPLVAALANLILPWTPSRAKNAKKRIGKGHDFGSMPEDERYADWS